MECSSGNIAQEKNWEDKGIDIISGQGVQGMCEDQPALHKVWHEMVEFQFSYSSQHPLPPWKHPASARAARLQGAAGGRRDGASKKIGVTCKTLKPRILFGEVSYVYHCVDVAYILLAASTMASTQQLVSGFACMIASELDFDSCEVTSHGQ